MDRNAVEIRRRFALALLVGGGLALAAAPVHAQPKRKGGRRRKSDKSESPEDEPDAQAPDEVEPSPAAPPPKEPSQTYEIIGGLVGGGLLLVWFGWFMVERSAAERGRTAFRAAAQRLHLSFTPGSGREVGTIAGQFQGNWVEVRAGMMGATARTSAMQYTTIETRLPAGLPPDFPRVAANTVGRGVPGKYLATGNPDFDAAWVVEGDPNAVRRYISPAVQHALLALRVVSERAIPLAAGQPSVKLGLDGAVADPLRLQALLEAQFAVAHALSEVCAFRPAQSVEWTP